MRTIFSTLFITSVIATAAPPEPAGWRLAWHDEFDGRRIDAEKWSPCERGTPDWKNTMTDDPRCYEIGDGTLKLIGIENPDTTDDPAPFLTGGLSSEDKFEFTHGKIRIRARFQSARGAWPALWMLGTEGRWPSNGEIDLMEHLNYEDKVYQTIHSGYANANEANAEDPPKGSTTTVERDAWNTYGAEWSDERIVFTVNGEPTFTYPRMPEKGEAQWPFDQPFFLILSMQVGGSWVGEPDPADYPAHLEIDWVRVYEKRKD